MTTNINNSPKYACRTCMKQQCGCKDTESELPCHFYTERPKQEPVGYFAYDEEHNIWEELTRPDAPGATPLYAAPVRTKDLTEPLIDELRECRDLLMCVESCSRNNFENLAYERVQAIDAVIAADREKNNGQN